MGTRKAKILMIDDEKDLCFFVKANLEIVGNYEVLVATSGKEGLRAAGWHRPDLILLDIMMPVMDGFEVLKRLKADTKTEAIPVIMLTARADDESKMKAAGLYGDDYLVKPVEFKTLKARVDGVLSSKGFK